MLACRFWFARLRTLARLFLLNFLKQTVSNMKTPPPDEARYRGCWRNQPHFCSTLQARPTRIKGRHGTFFSLKKLASIRHTLAPSVCGTLFAAISGRKGVPTFKVVLRSQPVAVCRKLCKLLIPLKGIGFLHKTCDTAQPVAH